MGWLDRAKKIAEQAKDKAEEALGEVKARTESAGEGATAPTNVDERLGTPYIPGMLGTPGWRERGLPDPAAVLPIDDRDRVGIPHGTKSEIVQEPFGMGRRWTSAGRSAGLFYRLTGDQRAWQPPRGGGASAELDDGRTLVFLDGGDVGVVVELKGLDAAERDALTTSAAQRLPSG